MDYEKIGKFIYELRKNKKLTQKDLAESLNVTIQAVSKWERGLGCPDVSLLRPLSEYLGVSISELLNGEKIKKENVLEKADDILMKNLEENDKRTRKERLIFVTFLVGLILIFYSFTLNIYTSFRMLIIISILLIALYIPIIINKKTKLWHIAIPACVFGSLILFDYISVSIFQREPIIYYDTVTEVYNGDFSKRYDSIFYTAYQCSTNDIYELSSIKDSPNNYCFKRYNHTIVKSASITSKEGYIYFLGIRTSYEKEYAGNNIYFLEAFDLSNIYESDYMKENNSNVLVPHGDNDLSYAPKSVKNDLLSLQNFLYEKKLNKKIEIKDLNDLHLDVITKEEVVNLFNKVIDSDHSEIQYKLNRSNENIKGVNYEVIYMIENNKITHVKINIKNSKFQLDNDYLNQLENKIIELNTFDIKNEIIVKNNYLDLINMLHNINI